MLPNQSLKFSAQLKMPAAPIIPPNASIQDQDKIKGKTRSQQNQKDTISIWAQY